MMALIARASRSAPELLLAAGVLVGVAIALEGTASRAVNGVAGILWIGTAVLLFRQIWKNPNRVRLVGATIALDLVLVLMVRPSDLLWASAGFAAGGAAIALIASRDHERTSLLLPALWLPIHLVVAVVRAAERAIRDLPATVRTDPPPTAALVPLAMIVAAYAGAFLARRWMERREGARARSAAA